MEGDAEVKPYHEHREVVPHTEPGGEGDITEEVARGEGGIRPRGILPEEPHIACIDKGGHLKVSDHLGPQLKIGLEAEVTRPVEE